jgi:hypothetical protein
VYVLSQCLTEQVVEVKLHEFLLSDWVELSGRMSDASPGLQIKMTVRNLLC